MKKAKILFGITLLIVFTSYIVVAENNPDEKLKNMPANVKAIVEKSCYGCHNSNAKNENAKEELNFDKIGSLSKIRMIGAYKRIGESVEENDMPPKKFLQNYPDKKLSNTEKEVLITWAKKQAENLVEK